MSGPREPAAEADRVSTGLARIVRQLAPWTTARYGRVLPDGRTGGEAVHQLAQTLADLAAAAESQPRRPVPRIGDSALPDQLRVLVADLLAADPDADALAAAANAITGTARTLDSRAP